MVCSYIRQELVAPLYQLLKYYQDENWQLSSSDIVSSLPREDGTMPLISLDYIQQLIFINLERLATTILSDTSPEHAVSKLPFLPKQYLMSFIPVVHFSFLLVCFHRFCQAASLLLNLLRQSYYLTLFIQICAAPLFVCQVVSLQFRAVDDLDIWV